MSRRTVLTTAVALLAFALSATSATPAADAPFKDQQRYLDNGANKHLYCSLCTRIIEELYQLTHQHTSTSATAVSQGSIVDTMMDKNFRRVFTQQYAVSEIGSLTIGRRYFRKVVRPEWVVPVELLPPGGQMPELWQEEVNLTYDALTSSHKADIASYISSHPRASLNATLQKTCTQYASACPPEYTYPASDLAPRGTEQQIKPGEVLQLPDDMPDDAGYEDEDDDESDNDL